MSPVSRKRVFRVSEVAGLYYLYSKYRGTDREVQICAFVVAYAKIRSSQIRTLSEPHHEKTCTADQHLCFHGTRSKLSKTGFLTKRLICSSATHCTASLFASGLGFYNLSSASLQLSKVSSYLGQKRQTRVYLTTHKHNLVCLPYASS